jgi:hypothetical protein
MAEPIFGYDVSANNRGFSPETAARNGHRFGIARATGGLDFGPGGAGGWTPYMDVMYPEFSRRIRESGVVEGAYGFPVDASFVSIEDQVDAFVDAVGDPNGKLIAAVDYELYGPRPGATPTPTHLGQYIHALREIIGNHPILLYAGRNFWNEPPHSGLVKEYGDNVFLWAPWYYSMDPVERPFDHYARGLRDPNNGWWLRFGGRRPIMSQFCIGAAGGLAEVDINAFRLTENDLKALTIRPTPNEDEEDHDPEPRPPQSQLMRNLDIIEDYGKRLVGNGVRYWCWDGGNLNVPRSSVGRPAAVDGPAPDPTKVRRGFCADLVSWQLRKLGKPIPKNRFGNENYDGGTRSFRLRYASQMKPFKASECRRGDVVFVDFQSAHAPEGHIAYCLGDGPNGKVLQSHLASSCDTGEPGFNTTFTLAQSNATPSGANYYRQRIPREAIWG